MCLLVTPVVLLFIQQISVTSISVLETNTNTLAFSDLGGSNDIYRQQQKKQTPSISNLTTRIKM